MAMVFEESPVRLRQVYINLFQNANILEEKRKLCGGDSTFLGTHTIYKKNVNCLKR